MTASQHTIESDTTIEPAVGPPWPLDPRIHTWRTTDGVEVRFQFRELGAVIQVGQYNLCVTDTRSASPFEAAPPPPAGILEGIDCASYQPKDLTELINSLSPRPQHAVIRMYQEEYEGPSPDISIAQVESAQANGLSCSGYVWIYRDINGGDSVRSALKTADRAGLVLPILWLDLETYENTAPDLANVHAAVDTCLGRGVKCGIYTGSWFWRDYLDDTHDFAHLPLWYANYNDRHDLVLVDPFGGWTSPAAGHQYTSTPCDLNVFDASVTVPP